MNPEQYFNSFLNDAVDKGLKPNQVFNERERIWRENIQPALVKKGANDTDLTNAMKRWQEKTNEPMMQLGFLPKDGQSSRGAAKDLRAERAVRETAKTGSKLPIIKETALSTAETIANAFGQGANNMVGSAARFANDIGENEKGTVLDRIANSSDSTAKAFGKSASSQQNAMQSGDMGKAAQLGLGAVQSIPAMALPMGAAAGTTKLLSGVAKAAAPYMGLGIGTIAGHTQNYGEVRQGATQKLQHDFPTWQELQGNPLYEQKFNENLNAGLSVDQSRQKAHADTLDTLSENAADKFGTAMTALDIIAPSGAVLGSGILKKLPNSAIGNILAGGKVNQKLVQQELKAAERTGISKYLPDISLEANKAALKMVGKQGLEEGLQGAIGEYGSQSASANIGGTPIDWKQVGQSFVDEGIVGAIMGGGMQSASGHTPSHQAKTVVKELRNQTNALRKDEALARSNLSEAMQFNSPDRIIEAENDLQLIQERAKNLHESYATSGIDTPYFIQRLLPTQQEPGVNQDESTQPTQTPIEVPSQAEEVEPPLSQQTVQQEQPSFKPAGYDMADTTNLVVKAVSDGVLSLDQAEKIQRDPVVGAIFGHAVIGDKASAHQTIMDAVSNGAIDLPQAESLSKDIDIFASLNGVKPENNHAIPVEPAKPTLTSIVNNHVKEQVNSDINQPELSDFGYALQSLNPAQSDPNISTFDTTEPQFIQQEQSGIIDTDEPQAQNNQEAFNIDPNQPDQQQFEPSFADKFRDAHLNNPELKPKLINDEIASGRNRADVLKEVSSIVSETPKLPKAIVEKQAHIQPEFKTFSNTAKANEYIRKNNLAETHEPVAKDGLFEVQPKSAPVKTEVVQKTIDNGTPKNQPEDIGRAKDNMPFANQQSASLALKKKGLEKSHFVHKTDGGYVLRSAKPVENNADLTSTTPRSNKPNVLGISHGDKITLPETKDALGNIRPSETFTVSGLDGNDLTLTTESGARSLESAKLLKQRYGNKLSILKNNDSSTTNIDTAANEAATSPQNNIPEPTQAQIEAGNYKKGHIKVQGLPESDHVFVVDQLDQQGRNTWEDMPLEQRQALVQQIDTSKMLPPTVKRLHTAQWENIGDEVKARLVGAMAQQSTDVESKTVLQPLDHGVLNVPLSKRGNIDTQLDRYNKEQASIQQNKRDVRNMEYAEAQAIAKPMFETLGNEQIQNYAQRANIKPSDAKKELKAMAHWQPQKAIKVYEALKNTQPTGIDTNANEAATSPQNNIPEPTQAQIEAGNYKKGHIKVHGLDISIESPKGSERHGTDPNGKEWAHTMSDHYGYIKKTTGADNEQIDTYIGQNPDSDQVFIVDQIDQKTGKFDEHKIMLGFNDLDSAQKAYKSNFDKGWKVGPIKSMNMNEFKDWLKNEDTTKPSTDIKYFSKNDKENVSKKVKIQIHSDAGITHNIPENLLDQSHKLGDVVEDLVGMSSNVESDTKYSEDLLRKIAKLNPDIEVIFTNDPKLASGLSEGGHYPFSQDGSEKVYIYPQGNWESSILNLVNHELVHAVTHKAIVQNKVSQTDLSFLNHFSETLGNWMFKNPMVLDEWIESRFDYGIRDKYHNELMAVFTAETDVRKSLTELQGQLLNESKEQARNFAGTQKNDNGEFQQTPSGNTKINEGPATESERSQENRGSQYQRQVDSNRIGKIGTQVHLLDEFDNVVQRIMGLNDEQPKQSGNIKDSKRGRTSEVPNIVEKELITNKVSTKEIGSSSVFGALSNTGATDRVISFFDHLKMPATQDSSSNGRFNVRLNGSGVGEHGFTLQVVTSFADLPKVIQQAATYQDENGKTQNYSVSGVWHDDTLYVVTDQIYGDRAKQFTTSDAYEELLTHEIIGHFGVQQVFGKEYKTKFQQLYNALGGQAGILKIAKENGVDIKQFKEAYIDPFTKGIKEGYYDPLDVQQATVSELFAFIAQNEKTRPFVQQKLKELLGYIRQWFRDHGLLKLEKYNDADIMMFLAEARKAVVDRDLFGKFSEQSISSKRSPDISQDQQIAKSGLSNQTYQFSLNEANHSPFNKAIDDVVNRDTPTRYIKMGKTPDVLKMLGIPDAQVFIHGDVIEKVMAQHLGLAKGEHSNIHNLTPDTLRQLPQQINNPVAVFKSANSSTNANGYVILTELIETDIKTGKAKPVVAALNVKTKGKNIEVVNIVSMYGRSHNQLQNALNNDLLYWHNEKGQRFVATDGLQLPQVLRNNADLSKTNIKTNDDLVKYQEGNIPKFSRKVTANPDDLPESTQQKILDAASKSFFGQAALLGLERSKTISKQTGRLFSTMLHKALQDKDFKVTFDLVQDKINHVTFASSDSMDVAPDILTQLETGSDYWKEAKKVGQQLGHTAKLRDKPEFQKDLEIVGDVLFENTLSEEPKVFTDHDLRKKNLSQEQINLYRQARTAIDTSLDSFAKTTISNIYKHLGGKSDEILEITAMNLALGGHVNEIADRMAKIVENDPDKAEAAKVAEEHIEKVVTRLEQLKNEGYMPLMRFGKYYMRVVDPTTKEVAYRQHFESEAERNLFVRNYKAPEGYKVESSQLNELEHKLFQGVSPETVALFAKEAGLPVGDAEAAYIKHAVRDNHALKRLLRRQGVQGFNTDTKRVLAAFVLSNARYAANQLYNPAIDESITEINDPAYAEDAIRLRDYALDTQEEVAGIKNFAFVWYMGASFMFGLVNLTQPLLQTLPYLLQYSTDAGSVPRAFIRAAKSWYGKDIPTKYQDHYERARREGHLDPQNTWMLQGLERGKSGLGASTWQLISHASGFFAQASETVNRRTALFAALDIAGNMGKAKLEKLGFKDAYDFAVRTIQETQGVYNKGNRPRVSRGNVGSLLMMYKQFMISYVEQMVRMQRSGLWGGEDDEFKKRMAALVGFGISRTMLVALGVLWSFAGATGLPFMRDLLDVVETAGGMVGKPVNTEREVQIALTKALGDTLGTAATTILLDGPVNLNPVIDVKGRMGMGDLIPATAYFSPMTSEWQKSKELSGMGGAIGGLMEKASSAMDYAQIGAYGQAATQLAPKAFTSLGQGAVAAATGDYRNMQTGVKTNDATILDGFIKMLDAQPSRIAKEGRVRGLEMKDKAALQYVNKRAKEDYEKVLESGDQKQIINFRKAIDEYNATEPRYPITMNLKRAETNFAKSNMNWQEKRKTTKGLDWMDDYNPYLETEQ